MFSILKPTHEKIRAILAEQSAQKFTYDSVGATAGRLPADFEVDHERFKMGAGAADFERAKAALRRWEQFDLGWVEAHPNNAPIEKGTMVSSLARSSGLWVLNVCRIVYAVDEIGPVSRFGFAYGTLPWHVEMGEERFLIEWNRASDEVWFDILAFSRPRHILTRLAFPLMRLLQKRFRHDSAEAMLRAVGKKPGGMPILD